MRRSNQYYPFAILAVAANVLLGGCASRGTASFATPEEAVRAIVKAGEDRALAEKLLGAGGFAMLRSGDEVADRADLEAVRAKIAERVVIEDLGLDSKVALLGNDGWELPIPLMRTAGGWSFDVEAGKEEILALRIGRNELSTIATLRALVDAQREYAAIGRDGRPPAYASRIWSREKQHDGLYWPAADGEPESPIGPLVAEAAGEGYERGDGASPYHGYHYRLLTAQGADAPGGARSYVDDGGSLTRGFAVIAWPAIYDNSGVMTFVVSHQGIVFQRDLGADTARLAAEVKAYDPSDTWDPSID